MTFDELYSMISEASDFSSEAYGKLFKCIDVEQKKPLFTVPLYYQIEREKEWKKAEAYMKKKERDRQKVEQKRLEAKQKVEDAKKQAKLKAEEERRKAEEERRKAEEERRKKEKLESEAKRKAAKEEQKKIESERKAAEERERKIVERIKPDADMMIAGILCDMVHIIPTLPDDPKFWITKDNVCAENMNVLQVMFDSKSQKVSCENMELLVNRFSKVIDQNFHIPSTVELFYLGNVKKDYKVVHREEWNAELFSGLKKVKKGKEMLLKPRFACSEETYNKSKNKAIERLKMIINKYVNHLKSVEYKSFLTKKTIQYIDRPFPSELYYALLYWESLEKSVAIDFYGKWLVFHDDVVPEKLVSSVLPILNSLFKGEKTFELMSSNSKAYSFLRQKELVGNGVYLIIKE